MAENNMKFQLQAHIGAPLFKKDGSATLKFFTQEIADDQVVDILNMGRRDELGWLLWAPNKFQETDLPTAPATDDRKTPAQRLRSVLFLLWKQEGSRGDFESFYQERMGKIIDIMKGKLDNM